MEKKKAFDDDEGDDWVDNADDMIIYVETSTVKEENIKKREITILYTERDMFPAGTP